METTKAAPEPPPPRVETPKPEPPPPPVRRQETAEASYMADTRWAPGGEGKLVQGLNGGQYSPYKPNFIEEVQRFLFDQELYDGPATGVLDEATMEAVAAFQRAHGVEASGVPSPETREAMAGEGGARSES